MQLHGNDHGRVFPFVGPFPVSAALKQKSPLGASGPKSFDALELDAGLSLPVVPVRKSPRVGIERERHGQEFSGFEGKGKGLGAAEAGLGGESAQPRMLAYGVERRPPPASAAKPAAAAGKQEAAATKNVRRRHKAAPT